MGTNLFSNIVATYCFCRDFEIIGALIQIFLAISFVFLGAFHFSAHAKTKQSAGHLSEEMLKTCIISATLCKKEDLLPEHLEEMG